MRREILDLRYQNQDVSASMLGRGFRTQLGLVLEAKLGSSWSQVAPKSAQGGAQLRQRWHETDFGNQSFLLV